MLLRSENDVRQLTGFSSAYIVMAKQTQGQKLKEEHKGKRCLVLHAVAKRADNLISAVSKCFVSPVEQANVAIIMATENFSLRDIIKYGLISLGYAIDPAIYDNVEDGAFYSWTLSALSPVIVDADIEKVAKAGIKTLLRLIGPQTWSGDLSFLALAKQIDSSYKLGSPVCTIKTSFVTSGLANCNFLGLDPHIMMDHAAASPFLRQEYNGLRYTYISDDKIIEEIPGCSSERLCDLRPTREQLTIPHHPYLDIIPWPSFRSQAIIASSMNPPLIDKSDLCLDLLSDGIYCHSVGRISLHGRGDGMPWDMRSWEAKPWFLKKWWFLASGLDIQQTSLWWRLQS